MIRWDEKMKKKVHGKRCVVCGEVVNDKTEDLEYIQTRRKTDIFIHQHCLKNWRQWDED